MRVRDPSAVGETIREKIQNFDPDLPVMRMHPMVAVVADSLWLRRMSADLSGLTAVCGLVLAATGIYVASRPTRQLREARKWAFVWGSGPTVMTYSAWS